MSYCRLWHDGSEVYCYEDVGGYIAIWSPLGEDFKAKTARIAIDHLRELQDKYVRFPNGVIEEIAADNPDLDKPFEPLPSRSIEEMLWWG